MTGSDEPVAAPRLELREILRRLKGDGLGAKLARGGMTSLTVTASGMVVSFFVQILLARTLGGGEYGIYAYVLSWMNILLYVAKFGFDNASLRFTSAYIATEDHALLRGYLRVSQSTAVLIALVLSGLGLVVLEVIGGRLEPSLRGSFYALSALLPVTAILLIKGDILQGLQRIARSQAPHMLLRPLLLGAGFLAVATAGWRQLRSSDALWINVAASIVALLVASVWLARDLPRGLRSVRPRYQVRTWFKVAGSIFGINVFQIVLSQQADVFIVGTIQGTASAGVYAAASQLALPMAMGMEAVLFIGAPIIAELHAQGNRAELQRLVRLTGWASIFLAVPVFLAFVGLGPWALSIYGESFASGYPVLIVLGLNNMVTAGGGALGGWMITMMGYERKGLRIVAAGAMVNIVLTVALVPILGMLGAALGTLIATALRLALLTWLLKREVGVMIIPSLRRR